MGFGAILKKNGVLVSPVGYIPLMLPQWNTFGSFSGRKPC